MTPQNPPFTAARTAAVIGADPAGVTAALGLLDAGFDVALYSDRDQNALRNRTRPGVRAVAVSPQPTGPAGGGRRPGRVARPAGRIAFDGYVGVTVDSSFETSGRITSFVERGGAFLVESVTPESLGAIAASTDLTLVAAARGRLSGYFPPAADRPVHRGSPRSLQGLYVLTRTTGSDRAEPNPPAAGPRMVH
ncbi:hypothetical protein [Nocardia testacea]|uniref:hypothetical protein n=1 Tax=Nocardia testacea TaxID=248551 RepID=UPI003A858817